ncbi:N-acetylmuramoyl-L-alanine amidase [Staphylococcus succinus]|uniref:N-acetylmuramoyl-L-alanine amidase n=1 Tax=Staphylococcus succinus TaxID=61015 RepID=UPI00301CC270
MTSNKTVKKTKKQAHSYMNKLKGKGWDFDLAFGWQCYDLSNTYFNHLTNDRLYGLYAKDIHIDNKKILEEYGTIYENVDDFLPEKGDIFIMNGNYGQGAGHTGIVWSANLNTFVGLEQNWYGGGRDKTEVAQLVTHSYDNPLYFWRPNYKAKKKVVDVPKKDKVKSMKILIASGHGYSDPGAVDNGTNERDFIREYIAPNIQKYLEKAGHTVDLYGGKEQSQNLYTDTAYGERLGDTKNYGMYWVKQQKYDVVVELHLDAASASATGGHVIISNQWPADKIDKDINNCLKATVGTIRGIDPRNDLLNANVAGRLGTNYRLVEMGFITNKKDMNYLKKNYDRFSKELAGAINGKPIGGTSAGNKQVKWNWKGRFIPNTAIKVRTSPSLKGKIVSNNVLSFTKVKTIKFNFIVKADGYWWISYTFKGKTYYSAICKITDKKERIKAEKYWGKLKWNWHD